MCVSTSPNISFTGCTLLFFITMEPELEKFMTSSWHKDFRDRRKSWHDSNPEVKKKKVASQRFLQTKLATKDKKKL